MTKDQARDKVRNTFPKAFSSKHKKRWNGDLYWTIMSENRGYRIGSGKTEKEAWVKAMENIS